MAALNNTEGVALVQISETEAEMLMDAAETLHLTANLAQLVGTDTEGLRAQANFVRRLAMAAKTSDRYRQVLTS